MPEYTTDPQDPLLKPFVLEARGENPVILILKAEIREAVGVVKLSYVHKGVLYCMNSVEQTVYGVDTIVYCTQLVKHQDQCYTKWQTRSQLGSRTHSGCKVVTHLPLVVAETLAADPGFYDALFCAWCNAYFSPAEFTWFSSGKVVYNGV